MDRKPILHVYKTASVTKTSLLRSIRAFILKYDEEIMYQNNLWALPKGF